MIDVGKTRYWKNLSPKNFKGLVSPLFSDTKRGKTKYSASLNRPERVRRERITIADGGDRGDTAGYTGTNSVSKTDEKSEMGIDLSVSATHAGEINLTVMMPTTPDGGGGNATAGDNRLNTLQFQQQEHSSKQSRLPPESASGAPRGESHRAEQIGETIIE